MKSEDIFKELQKKIFHPVYFLMGEEPYFIDEISAYIEEHVLNETEKEFNQTVVYGRDIDTAGIIAMAKRFPMMSNYQVVIIKEAQEVKDLVPIERVSSNKQKATEKKTKDKTLFEAYLEKPLKSTILVFCYKYKTIDRRKTLAKLIDKTGVLYEAEKIYENQLPQWIQNQLRKKNYTITPEAALLLSEYLGTNLGKVNNELGKLEINIKAGTEITTSHIEHYIGISKDFNVFELQKALSSKDSKKCFQIIKHFAANEKSNPVIMTLGVLYTFFARLLIFHSAADKSKAAICPLLGINPFFYNDYLTASKNYSPVKLRSIIGYLRKYDLKTKGVDNASTERTEFLKELIYLILE